MWSVERLTGSAAELHDRPLGPDVTRRVSVMELARPALVLGSTQRDMDADVLAVDAFEVELCRRRSGGGAVLLVPGQTIWIDLELPRGDPLWHEDVGRAFHWLGRAWVVALAELGVRATMHSGPVMETPWSRKVCFGGLGPGEVTVDGHKLVGISQRRTREGARFQCLVHRRWDPVPLLGLLALHHRERAAALGDLALVGAGLDVEEQVVVDALVRHLPAY
jgi:lipoate-protein ligase A